MLSIVWCVVKLALLAIGVDVLLMLFSYIAGHTNFLYTWEDKSTDKARFCHRYFFWNSDNFVLGPITFCRHYALIVSDTTLYAPAIRHEGKHTWQYRVRGLMWVWTHKTQRETEAVACQLSDYPKFSVVP